MLPSQLGMGAGGDAQRADLQGVGGLALGEAGHPKWRIGHAPHQGHRLAHNRASGLQTRLNQNAAGMLNPKRDAAEAGLPDREESGSAARVDDIPQVELSWSTFSGPASPSGMGIGGDAAGTQRLMVRGECVCAHAQGSEQSAAEREPAAEAEAEQEQESEPKKAAPRQQGTVAWYNNRQRLGAIDNNSGEQFVVSAPPPRCTDGALAHCAWEVCARASKAL